MRTKSVNTKALGVYAVWCESDRDEWSFDLISLYVFFTFDIDALRIVSKGINQVAPQAGCLVITHYQRLLDHVKADYVHVMIDGKIVKSGGPELAHKLEEQGYDWLEADA